MLGEIEKTTNGKDPAIGEAAWDVVEAGHRVLLDRIEILILELRQAAVSAQRQAVLSLVAVVLLTTAWIALNGAAVLVMREHLSSVAAGGLTAAINAVLGISLLAWTWKDEA